jgi:hypothetical protein
VPNLKWMFLISNRSTQLPILIASYLLFSECINGYFRVVPPLAHSKTVAGDLALKPIDLDIDPLYRNASPTRATRNELQQRIIARSDSICEQHKGDIFGNAAHIRLLTDISSATLSAAAAVVTGGAASNHSTGAALLNGPGTAIDSEIYQGLLRSSIIKAIDEGRERKLADIASKSRRDIDAYPLSNALADVQDYHFRCSFYHGITVLAEDPQQRMAPSKDEITARIDYLQQQLQKPDRMPVPQAEKHLMNSELAQRIDDWTQRLNTRH